jgi:DNA-binding response OmpR family regulator
MFTVVTERLLIADDDPNQLAAIETFFEDHGFNVRTAGNADDALAIYRVWLPDVAIFDIQMPGGDGRELTKEIRRFAAKPAPFLVALSGLASMSEPSRSLDAGFDRHFTKPTRLAMLWAAIAFRKSTRWSR